MTSDQPLERLRRRSADTEERLVVLFQSFDANARHYDVLRVQVTGLLLTGVVAGAAFISQTSAFRWNEHRSFLIFVWLVSTALLFAAAFFQSAYVWNYFRMYHFRKALEAGASRMERSLDQADDSQLAVKHLRREIDESCRRFGWRKRLFPTGDVETYLECIWIVVPILVWIAALACMVKSFSV